MVILSVIKPQNNRLQYYFGGKILYDNFLCLVKQHLVEMDCARISNIDDYEGLHTTML